MQKQLACLGDEACAHVLVECQPSPRSDPRPLDLYITARKWPEPRLIGCTSPSKSLRVLCCVKVPKAGGMKGAFLSHAVSGLPKWGALTWRHKHCRIGVYEPGKKKGGGLRVGRGLPPPPPYFIDGRADPGPSWASEPGEPHLTSPHLTPPPPTSCRPKVGHGPAFFPLKPSSQTVSMMTNCSER